MKSVTEFASIILNQGLNAKAALVADGKTAEEIQQKVGETFKFEGDKLKYFINAIEIAGQNAENLRRVLVQSFNEGEKTPPKAVKIEELHYTPEFQVDPNRVPAPKPSGKGGRGKGNRDSRN